MRSLLDRGSTVLLETGGHRSTGRRARSGGHYSRREAPGTFLTAARLSTVIGLTTCAVTCAALAGHDRPNFLNCPLDVLHNAPLVLMHPRRRQQAEFRRSLSGQSYNR